MSTVETVHQYVLTALLKGDLRPGEWIRQDDLAAELGISKVPVREALQRLSAEGLVSFELNRGSAVRSLTAADAEEIYALRMALEPMLLERSIGRLSIVDLATAEMALAAKNVSVGEANWAFHRALYSGAGWERAVTIVGRLHAAVAPYVVLYTEELSGLDASDKQHRKLLRLCRSGKAQKAVELLHEHLSEAAAALVEALHSLPAPLTPRITSLRKHLGEIDREAASSETRHGRPAVGTAVRRHDAGREGRSAADRQEADAR